ncbi:ABC transporter permease [Rubritalea spongiae]|uniref:Transport permease protein n=1 Tax=Rubritalea spongiae TaxID=430797 RepID=A0ABW5E6C5_9BACT
MPIRIREHSPWKTQVYVTKALLQREAITRFGKYKLGFVWMLIDPLVSVIILGLILGPVLGRSSGEVPYAFFLLCGFMLLKLLTGPMSSGIGAISSNKGLLVFKKVQPLDPFISKFLFDLLSSSFAFTVFCLVGSWFGIPISTDNLFTLFFCIVCTWAIGSGLGIALGIACTKFAELEKIIAYIQRPLLFISCVLYPSSNIPATHIKYLLLNPLVHTIEYSRMCLFPNYKAPGVNLAYPALFALISLSLGFMTYRNNRHYLAQR